jgi:hypothetical protein
VRAAAGTADTRYLESRCWERLDRLYNFAKAADVQRRTDVEERTNT